MKNQPGTLKSHGNQPKTMKNHETTLKTMETNQKPWKTMKLPWKTMETNQKPWKTMKLPWKTMETNPKPWKTMKLPWKTMETREGVGRCRKNGKTWHTRGHNWPFRCLDCVLYLLEYSAFFKCSCHQYCIKFFKISYCWLIYVESVVAHLLLLFC